MSRWTVPPGCDSIKMKSDGRVIKANRSGSVHVPDHYDSEMKASAQHKRGYAEPGRSIVAHGGEGKRCARCNFHAFAFSKTCPKCKGTEFTPEEG